MSLEGQNPITQAGSEKFIDGVHPTDGVRPFNEEKGELADPAIHEPLLERGVPSVDSINPHTLDVHVDKIPVPTEDVATKKRMSKRGVTAIVASTVSAAVLGGASVLGYSHFQNDKPEKETTSQESPSPESPESALSTPEDLVGTIVNNDIEHLNAKPTETVLESIATPISENEGIEDAAIMAGQKINAFYLSGDYDIDASSANDLVTLTPGSQIQGNEMLSNIFSSSIDTSAPSFDWMRGTRANIANRLDYYGTTEQYNMALEKPEYATHTSDWRVVSSQLVTPTKGTVTVEVHQLTNFEELDRSDLFNHPEIDTNQTFSLDVAMTIENGEWRVASLTSSS